MRRPWTLDYETANCTIAATVGITGELVALMQWGDQYEAGPAGPQARLTHRDCGQPIRLQLTCAGGHALSSARDVTPLPGPGARRIAS